MGEITEQRALRRVAERLAELVGVPPGDVEMEWHPSLAGQKTKPVDAKIAVGGFKFLVEWKSSGTAASVTMAVRSLRKFVENSREKLIPVVAAPFIGPVGQRLCQDADVGWLDLSGNARLVASGLRVVIEGKPNQFKRPGRPRSLFAPKSSRIARYLLEHPDQLVSQRELAKATTMDEGFTSRIVRGLEAQRLVSRNSSGEVRVADFDALLDAWREAYDFSKHHIVRGHIAARSGEQLMAKLSDVLKRGSEDYAVTGLAGAWLLDPFAGFRLVTFFVMDLPPDALLDEMGFREERRGENVWLVVPNDEGVFHGATDREGIRCVHPVQVYLDLKGHPERSTEAAAELRKKWLSGERHAE